MALSAPLLHCCPVDKNTAPRRRRDDRSPLYETASFKELQVRLTASLRRLRDKHGYTQEEAAWRCDMPTRLYVSIEHGESNATLVTIARLCAGFEVDVTEIFAAVPTRRGRKAAKGD